jgi:peptidoglycan/LPS O-acetylase OafA/YrhL
MPVALASCYLFLLFGCLMAQLALDERWATRLEWLASPWVPVAAIALLATGPGRWGGFLAAGLAALSLPSLATGRGPLAGAMGTRAAAWFGRLSYALYLVHQLGLNLARRILQPGTTTADDWRVLLVGLAIAVPASIALHLLVERPAIRAGRRLSAALLRRQ